MSLLVSYGQPEVKSAWRNAGSFPVSGTTLFVGISVLLAVVSLIAASKGLPTAVMF